MRVTFVYVFFMLMHLRTQLKCSIQFIFRPVVDVTRS